MRAAPTRRSLAVNDELTASRPAVSANAPTRRIVLAAVFLLLAACGGSNDTEFPRVTLTQDGTSVEGQQGTSHWNGVWGDAFGTITLAEPTTLDRAGARLGGDPPFTSVVGFNATPVDPDRAKPSREGDRLRWQSTEGFGQPVAVPVGPDGAIDLSGLTAGAYLLGFVGGWPEGEVEYGFYVTVR